jgi:hypothetical protein
MRELSAISSRQSAQGYMKMDMTTQVDRLKVEGLEEKPY